MNELAESLIDQFVLESGECLANASDALLELEKNQNKADSIDQLFRALHTLKGNAALFDLQPVVNVAHIAEDILDTIRKGQQAMNDGLATAIFSVIDQIASWVNTIEHTGRLPDDARTISDELHKRLEGFSIREAKSSTTAANFNWVANLPPHAWLDISQQDQSLVAVLYIPDEGCFFSGDDPLQIMRDLPGLCALHMEFRSDPPPFSKLEIFTSYLHFMALSASPAPEVVNYCREYKDQMAIKAITQSDLRPTKEIPDTAMLQQILAAQLKILELPNLLEGNHGKLSACVHSISNALRYMKLEDALVQLTQIQENIEKNGDLTPLRQFVSSLIADPSGKQVEVAPKTAETSGKKFLQIEQGRIDQLLNLIGEMTAAKNNLQYLAERAEELSREFSLELKDRSAAIEHITQEMQDIAVSFRMTPISSILKRLPRLVRDLGKELDRKAKLIMEGGETEADRHVIDSLSEPLLHMLRNSMAHGIEAAEEREAAGKNAMGLIRIKAYHRNNQLMIDIQDDGRGIDAQNIKQKAVANGILTAEEAARMEDAEALQLIFYSGFSLAKEVTNIAGRGVGMDIVKSTVESAGGTISIRSEVGIGTSFTLALPLFIASAQMMTLRTGDQLFGIPMQQVEQTLKVPRKSIRKIKHHETFIYRDSVTPLLRLHALLSLPTPDQEELSVVVVRLHQGLVGLAVEQFCNPVEAVIKPLNGILRSLSNFSGSALLPDNSVLLVLNLEELIGAH